MTGGGGEPCPGPFGGRVAAHSRTTLSFDMVPQPPDLVLRAPGLRPIPAGDLAAFTEALRDSNIPFLMDAHDWARLPEVFQREIERDHVVLAEGNAQGSRP